MSPVIVPHLSINSRRNSEYNLEKMKDENFDEKLSSSHLSGTITDGASVSKELSTEQRLSIGESPVAINQST